MFKELKEKIVEMATPGYPWRAIFIVGSKGFGKSWAMKKLCSTYDGYYVNLRLERVDFEIS